MRGFFAKLLGKGGKLPGLAARDPIRYEREKDIAAHGDETERLTLARNSRTHQEILYFLAEKDPDPAVRLAVAENPSMPVQVGPVLAVDQSVDVRMALAGRLIELLPGLSQDKHSQLYAYAVQALATLALDEVLKIRRALSSALKDHAHAPPKVAGQLARDIEREVAEPILRFCTALSDADLLDILQDHPAGWVVQAVACRDEISPPVSQAVIDTGDAPAGRMLAENEGAQFSPALLEQVIDMARSLPEWQEPLAARKQLPPAMAKKLAEFVDASVRDMLLRRADFEPDMAEEIAAVFRRRLDFASRKGPGQETVIQRVARMARESELTEETVSDALGMQDRAFVMAALAHLTRSSVPDISRVFEMKAPRSIVAVTWKAGLSMRLALQLQKDLAQVPHKELIYPRDGSDFPLTEDELLWQLDFLGLDAA